MLLAQENEMNAVREIEKQRYKNLFANPEKVLAGASDYDALYYKLNINLFKDSTALRGDVVMKLKSLAPSLAAVEMNFWSNGTVDSVVSEGIKLQFAHANNVVTVQLPTPLLKDQMKTIRTYYRSRYTTQQEGGGMMKVEKTNKQLNRQIITLTTQAEPYDARKWWPCDDDTRDKADSVDVIVTTNLDMHPVSNGSMKYDVDNGNGTHTVAWSERYPIVTYLVSVACATYNYRSYSFSHSGKTMPVVSYFYTLDSNEMKPREKYMLDGLKIFSDLFITYPFINEKYGMAEYTWGGAMEHQTCSSMGSFGESVIAHELAHQWFGDKVTCHGFEHIWLNEGWATYCEALYYEAKNGVTGLKQTMASKAYYGAGTIIVEDPNNFGSIFDGNLSYAKGGWTLHMLRHFVGDSNFFRAVRKYLGDTSLPNYRTVTTEEFQTYMERESGLYLRNFFKNWIYGEYFPTYKYDWKSTPAGSNYKIDLKLTQMYVPQRQVFDMPIDITFRKGNFDTTFVVRDSSEILDVSFTLPFNPETVLLDKDNWILKRVVMPVVNPTFDKGILLVNGVSWDVSAYTNDIKTAYADSIFTGKNRYDFWDIFPNPRAGYPANITSILGSGTVLPNIIGQYCTVVWIGNAYSGDDAEWANSPIFEYIKAGGNVILLTRQGQDFIDPLMQDFLGITWTSVRGVWTTFTDYKAKQPELVDVTFTGAQDILSSFSPILARPENKLLFQSGTQGAGVWGKPKIIDGKMSGNLIFLSMRPYRVEHASMKTNMDYLIGQVGCAKPTEVPTVQPSPSSDIWLGQNYPNPLASNGQSTTISFSVNAKNGIPAQATLKIYDQLGREIAILFDGIAASGIHRVNFHPSSLPDGMYYYQLSANGNIVTRAMIVLK